MKKYYIIYSYLILGAFSLGAQHSKNPQADAIFHKISKEYTLNVDGSIDYRCVKQVQLLTYHAIHRLYGETFIIYDPDYQQLIINECYTVMADGKKVITPANAFNEVLPRFAANAPVFNRLKEMVVTHTALEIGSTIYLDYTLKTKKGFYPALMGQEQIAESNPVTSFDLAVRVPDGTPLNFRLYHAKGEPTMGREGYMRVYTWHLDNIKAYIPEPCEQDISKFLPTLVFTTARDMNQLLGGQNQQSAFRFDFSDEMKSWTDKIQKENKSELSTVLALQEKVVNEFNLYNVPLNTIGYRVRSAEEVWKSAGGTEIEKAILFCSLLSCCKIQAELTAIFPGYYDPGMGNLLGMSHVYVLVTLKDKSTLLLSVSELNDQDLQLRKTLTYVPFKSTVNGDPVPAIQMLNQVSLNGKIDLDEENKLSGKISMKLEGQANPYLLLSRTPAKATSGIAGLGNGDISDYKILNTTKEASAVNLKVDKKNACKKESNYYFFNWPSSNGGINGWHTGEWVEDRFNPFEVPYPVTETYSYEMNLPAKWKLINPIEHFELANSAGQIKAECRQEKDKIFWICEIRLYDSPVIQDGGDYYRNIKALLSRWATIQSQGSIFREEK